MKPFISSTVTGLQFLYSDRLEMVMVASLFVAYVLVVSTRYCSKVSSKKREKQSSGVWQDGGTLGPGCSVNGWAAGAVSSTYKELYRYVDD